VYKTVAVKKITTLTLERIDVWKEFEKTRKMRQVCASWFKAFRNAGQLK
jgi:hypothetical protein